MRYLITGGTGTFGSAFVKRLLKKVCGDDKIVILSRDEDKQYWLKKELNSPFVEFVIGDVSNKESIREHFNGVDYVFHASAMKHVPSCEENPMSAVMTNIIGVKNVIDLCRENCVKKMVFLSTDKAVNPTSIMGMTKAIAENLVKTAKKCGTEYCVTRFGNVALSRGSVIPLFKKQIEENGQVTITSSKMNRYFITIEEAIDLVEYAFLQGKDRHIYIRDSAVYNILNVARAMFEIYGKEENIKEIGIRDGEKLDEKLFYDHEDVSKNGWYFEIDMNGKRKENIDSKYEVESYENTLKGVREWLNQ